MSSSMQQIEGERSKEEGARERERAKAKKMKQNTDIIAGAPLMNAIKSMEEVDICRNANCRRKMVDSCISFHFVHFIQFMLAPQFNGHRTLFKIQLFAVSKCSFWKSLETSIQWWSTLKHKANYFQRRYYSKIEAISFYELPHIDCATFRLRFYYESFFTLYQARQREGEAGKNWDAFNTNLAIEIYFAIIHFAMPLAFCRYHICYCQHLALKLKVILFTCMWFAIRCSMSAWSPDGWLSDVESYSVCLRFSLRPFSSSLFAAYSHTLQTK